MITKFSSTKQNKVKIKDNNNGENYNSSNKYFVKSQIADNNIHNSHTQENQIISNNNRFLSKREMSNATIKSHYKVSSLADLNSVSLKISNNEKKKEISVDNIYSMNHERNYLKNDLIKGSLIKQDSKNYNLYKDSSNSNTQENRERKMKLVENSNSNKNYSNNQNVKSYNINSASNSYLNPEIYPINYINKFSNERNDENPISSKSNYNGNTINKNERNFNKNIQIERSLSPFGESTLNKSFLDNKSVKGVKTSSNASTKINYVYPHQHIQNMSMFKSIKERPTSKQNKVPDREYSNVEYHVELDNKQLNKQKPIIKKQNENKSIGLGNTFKISNMSNNYINNMNSKNNHVNNIMVNNQNQFNKKSENKNDFRAKSVLNERKK